MSPLHKGSCKNAGDSFEGMSKTALVVFVIQLWVFPRREDEVPVEEDEREAGAYAGSTGLRR